MTVNDGPTGFVTSGVVCDLTFYFTAQDRVLVLFMRHLKILANNRATSPPHTQSYVLKTLAVNCLFETEVSVKLLVVMTLRQEKYQPLILYFVARSDLFQPKFIYQDE